jgi:hypothetical protein
MHLLKYVLRLVLQQYTKIPLYLAKTLHFFRKKTLLYSEGLKMKVNDYTIYQIIKRKRRPEMEKWVFAYAGMQRAQKKSQAIRA